MVGEGTNLGRLDAAGIRLAHLVVRHCEDLVGIALRVGVLIWLIEKITVRVCRIRTQQEGSCGLQHSCDGFLNLDPADFFRHLISSLRSGAAIGARDRFIRCVLNIKSAGRESLDSLGHSSCR